MKLLRVIAIFMAIVYSFTLTAQKSNHIYAHISAKPGLSYGLAGFQYERSIFNFKFFHVDAYAGLKTIWGGHFYKGLAYPSIPLGTNFVVGKRRTFLEIGGGVAYFWELGYKPELHIACKSIVYHKYFLKFSFNVDWIRTTDVFPIDDEHRTFKNMREDFSIGIALGKKMF